MPKLPVLRVVCHSNIWEISYLKIYYAVVYLCSFCLFVCLHYNVFVWQSLFRCRCMIDKWSSKGRHSSK